MYNLHEKHVKRPTRENRWFMAICLHVHVYLKQGFACDIVKFWSNLTQGMADRQVRRRLSEEEMNRGIGMLEAGLSQREVARVLGVSQSVVSRMWTRFHLTGNVMHQHAGVRERSTTRAQDRFIALQARRHQFNNATTLRRELQNATGVRFSTQTIRNRLHEAGLRSWRPAICIPLTRHHVQEHLEWARDHVTWALNDWTPILFTDKSRFCVDFTDRRARVWRMRNERFAEVCIAEHDRCGRGSVMVWAGISAQGKMDLHVIDKGTLTAERYVNEILDVHVCICRCCRSWFHSDGW